MTLKPTATYQTGNGLTVCEKIIPDGTVWKDEAKAKAAKFAAGALYKKQKKLCGTGKPECVTVHTTDDLPQVEDDAEQYARATYNENMGSARPHFYVDDVACWQLLKAGTGMTANDPKGGAEVGWHAGDGSTAGGGNMTSIGVEIIMNDSTVGHDARAYDNGAKLCAWLLYINNLPIDRLVTHSYWNAKKAGKTSSDIDQQCVTYVSGQHWCPFYIFDSKNESGALKNWKRFKAAVAEYLEALKKPAKPAASEMPFTDIEGKSCKEAVLWGVERGLIVKSKDGLFKPSANCTKAQAILWIWRLAKLLGKG